MIKKISIYFILIFFSTNVVIQDLIMKWKILINIFLIQVVIKLCGSIQNGTKNRYKEWCKKEATKPMLSREEMGKLLKIKKQLAWLKNSLSQQHRENQLCICKRFCSANKTH